MSFTMTKISDTIYQFNEPKEFQPGVWAPYVDSYLYLGSERAAVIDALEVSTDLYQAMREITDLPMDVLITHGHLDHAGAAIPEFYEAGCKIYMEPVDIDLLKSMIPETKDEWFTPLHDGDVFDLGDKKLETIACPGHSEGCVVFLDRENKVMFSGDTIGSGAFWMQIPIALPLGQFWPHVQRLAEKVSDIPADELLLYPGHRVQSPVQLTGQYIKDCVDITGAIMRGERPGTDAEMDMLGKHIVYKEVKQGMYQSYCYDPERL